MGKDVQFAFRVESPLRNQFVRACKELDRSAGQVLREFMRGFVKDNIQPTLFDDPMPNQQKTISEIRRGNQ